MKSFISRHRLSIGIFLFALAARLVLFSINFAHNDFQLEPTIHGDDGYYELSQNILAGNGFSFDAEPPYRPNPLRPPVWPYIIAFLAGIFGTYWAVFAVQVVLGSLIPVIGMHIARRMIGEKSVWAGILLSLEPYSILLSFILYTETAFTFFFLLSMLFVFRFIELRTVRNAVWSGTFLGLAILVKPTVQYFPLLVPIVLAIIWRKELSRHLGKCLVAFLLPCLALMGIWMYRNHAEFGAWGMSAQPSFNLYVYLVPTVLSIENGTSFSTELQSFVYRDGFDINSITLENAPEYKDRAVEVLAEHKAALVQSLGITAVTFFVHDGMLTVLQYAGITIPNIVSKPVISLLGEPSELFGLIRHYAASPALLILVARLAWIIVTLFCVIGMAVGLRRQRFTVYALSATLIVLYFMATTAINGLGVNARFKVPVNAFIFTFAISGFLVAWMHIRSRFGRHNA